MSHGLLTVQARSLAEYANDLWAERYLEALAEGFKEQLKQTYPGRREGVAVPGRGGVVKDLPVGLSENEWSGIGQRLAEVAHNNPWEIGAWLVYGEKNYNTPGDRRRALDLAANATGLDRNTLRQYAQVAKNVNRLTGLSWKHHRAVVSVMPPQKGDELLNEAKAQGWTLNQLQRAVKEWKGHSKNFDEIERTRERNRPAPPLQGKLQELGAALSEFNGFLDNGGHVSPTERCEICTNLAATAQLIAELLERLESTPDTSPEQVQSLLADQDWPATSELPAEPSDPTC